MDDDESAGIGHNSTELTDAQEMALFFNHLGIIRRHKEKLATATSDLRNLYKKAKSEGFTKKEVDHALAIENDEDDELAERRRLEEKIERWMAHPMGEQAELFASQNPAPGTDRAYAAGFRVGSEGMEMCKPPEQYAFDSEIEQSWIAGWQAGQAALSEIRAPLFVADDWEEEEATIGEEQSEEDQVAEFGEGEADFVETAPVVEAEAEQVQDPAPAKPKRTRAKPPATEDYNDSFRAKNKLPRVGKGRAAVGEAAGAENLGGEPGTFTEH